MPVVEKMSDGFYYLCTKKGEFRKMARLKEKPRHLFFVHTGFAVRFLKAKKKVYTYGKVQIGNMLVRLPEELVAKRVRFKVEFRNDDGEWE